MCCASARKCLAHGPLANLGPVVADLRLLNHVNHRGHLIHHHPPPSTTIHHPPHLHPFPLQVPFFSTIRRRLLSAACPLPVFTRPSPGLGPPSLRTSQGLWRCSAHDVVGPIAHALAICASSGWFPDRHASSEHGGARGSRGGDVLSARCERDPATTPSQQEPLCVSCAS